MSVQPVLELKEVYRIYRQGDQEVHALDGLSLRLEAGDFAAVAGPSGSGKTTLLNVAAGLDRPDRGSVVLDGREVTRLSRSERARLRLEKVGFIFQSFNLVPVLSARENAEFVLLLRGMDAAERRRRVDEVLREVGLEGLEHRRPSELSGGQQQRVQLARSLVLNSDILLLDEPLAALDAQLRKDMCLELKHIQAQVGITFVHVTHTQEEAMTIADRIAVMADGRFVDELRDPTAERILDTMKRLGG